MSLTIAQQNDFKKLEIERNICPKFIPLNIPVVTKNNYFATGTEIITANCQHKLACDIKVGDKLMGSDGNCSIVKKVVMSQDKMYEIIPNKGEKYIVNGDFVLSLKASNYEMINWDENRNRYRVRWLQNYTIREKTFALSTYGRSSGSKSMSKNAVKRNVHLFCTRYLRDIKKQPGYIGYGDIIEIKVKDYMTMKPRIRAAFKGFSAGIKFKERPIDVDPYILGYWLGDGASKAPEITTAEKEIVQYFTKYAQKNGLVLKKYGKYRYGITTGIINDKLGSNFFLNFLKKYHIWGNKHIPIDYIKNSKKNRLKLLAGLIDSDGHNSNNTYDFVFKSEILADNVIFLARSLGFKAFKKKVKKTYTNSSRGRVTGTYYRFCIHGEGLEKIPSLLKRKRTHTRETKKNAAVTAIKIKEVDKADHYGFVLDRKEKILLKDFTVVQCCN